MSSLQQKTSHYVAQTSSSAVAAPNDQEIVTQPDPLADQNVVTYCGNALLTNLIETPSTILLPTALVKIELPDRSLHWARAVLDGGLQIYLVTERLCQRLQIIKERERIIQLAELDKVSMYHRTRHSLP